MKTNKELFYQQLDTFKAPCGFVYYIERHTPKWETEDECFNELLSHVRLVNDYDPMQLHGYKKDEELIDMVKNRYKSNFEYDRKCKFTMKNHVVFKNESPENSRLMVEADENFICWVDYKLSPNDNFDMALRID